MITVTKKTAEVVTGYQIDMSKDDRANLVNALRDYLRLMEKHRNFSGGTRWPWVETSSRNWSDERKQPDQTATGTSSPTD